MSNEGGNYPFIFKTVRQLRVCASFITYFWKICWVPTCMFLRSLISMQHAYLFFGKISHLHGLIRDFMLINFRGKFLPSRLLWTSRLLNSMKLSHLHAYSELTFIRDLRVLIKNIISAPFLFLKDLAYKFTECTYFQVLGMLISKSKIISKRDRQNADSCQWGVWKCQKAY